MSGSSIEHASEDTPIRDVTGAEQHDAAISLAEVALRRRRTDKFRIQMMQTVLAALGISQDSMRKGESDGDNG